MRNNRNGTRPPIGSNGRHDPAPPIVAAAQHPPPDVPQQSQQGGDQQQEQGHLATLDRKLQLVRDMVAGVARGRHNGLYVWGPGGGGKSHSILSTLRELAAHYHVSNSRVSARGLFTLLKQLPDAVHVIEDADSMLRSPSTAGVLLSALWEQGGTRERVITWTTNGGKVYETLFSGGVIVCCNKAIDQAREELHALKTRIPVLHYAPTELEIRAHMRRISRQGYRDRDVDLTAGEALEVCDYVTEQAVAARQPLHLRLLINAFKMFATWDAGESASHWHDLVRSLIQERPATFTRPLAAGGNRDARRARDLEILGDILMETEDADERVRLWKQRTGKSQATFYRRLAELGGCAGLGQQQE